MAGASYWLKNAADGSPNSVTAATWSATSGGNGSGANEGGMPGGTSAAVTNPATTAPWEYPPRTTLVLGQVAAVACTRAPASRMPSTTVLAKAVRSTKSLLAG